MNVSFFPRSTPKLLFGARSYVLREKDGIFCSPLQPKLAKWHMQHHGYTRKADRWELPGMLLQARCFACLLPLHHTETESWNTKVIAVAGAATLVMRWRHVLSMMGQEEMETGEALVTCSRHHSSSKLLTPRLPRHERINLYWLNLHRWKKKKASRAFYYAVELTYTKFGLRLLPYFWVPCSKL